MTPWQGRQVYDHLRQTGARNVLELGTAHGVSAAYMAAAVAANGGGTVTTVDRYHFADPAPEEVLAAAGVSDQVRLVRIQESSYCWWLKGLIEQRRDEKGGCEPAFDFCYLDGAHDWHIDGLAVVLVERLLEPGGWLLMDDLDWTWARATIKSHRISRTRNGLPHRCVRYGTRSSRNIRTSTASGFKMGLGDGRTRALMRRESTPLKRRLADRPLPRNGSKWRSHDCATFSADPRLTRCRPVTPPGPRRTARRRRGSPCGCSRATRRCRAS